MFLLFWIPVARLAILKGINNLDDELASLCAAPLKVLTILPVLSKLLSPYLRVFLKECNAYIISKWFNVYGFLAILIGLSLKMKDIVDMQNCQRISLSNCGKIRLIKAYHRLVTLQ